MNSTKFLRNPSIYFRHSSRVDTNSSLSDDDDLGMILEEFILRDS